MVAMGRIEADLTDTAQQSAMSSEDVISVARQILPLADGFAVATESLDTGTGEVRLGLFRLGLDGRPRPEAVTSGARSELGVHATLPLASACQDAVRRAEQPIAEILADVDSTNLFEVAADSRVLVALMGDRDSFDGRAQRMLRFRLPPRGSLTPEELDLSPLALSTGRAITGIALQAGWLYAFVSDATGGFGVFRTPADGNTPPRFDPVLGDGAQRFALNAVVSAVGVAPQGLLLGTAALAPGAVKVGNWGPELLLLRHDGDWELLIGQPRFTPDGLKRPVSGRMPGMDNPGNAAVKAIATRRVEGGTMTYVLIQDFDGDAVQNRRQAVPDLLDYMGDVRIVRSADLVAWEDVPVSWPEGLGAVTAMVAAEAGLIVGHECAGTADAPVTVIPYP